MRISFAGGGTDVAPYPEREGGAVLSAAIRRYAYASARIREDDQFVIHSLDLGLVAQGPIAELSELDQQLHLLRGPISRLAGDDRGVELRVQSQAPPGSGLGASSTIVVAVVGALLAAYGRSAGPHRVAEMAVSIEREDLGLTGGTQDHYAAVFGGFNFLEFNDDEVTVNALRLPVSTVATLEHNLLLCDLGSSRESATIIDDQRERFERDSESTVRALSRQKELAVEMKQVLLSGDLDGFGGMLGESWAVKQELSPLVATDAAVRAYDAAISAGALGGKITGAGGGGFMLFYAPFGKRFEVAQELRELGHEVLDIALDDDGLQSWSHD
uniref:Unannotated protein n=1 Tax=freshwater metagenome TaxID=449393 RepID=A0A6J6A0N0_9ZZZZ